MNFSRAVVILALQGFEVAVASQNSMKLVRDRKISDMRVDGFTMNAGQIPRVPPGQAFSLGMDAADDDGVEFGIKLKVHRP